MPYEASAANKKPEGVGRLGKRVVFGDSAHIAYYNPKLNAIIGVAIHHTLYLGKADKN